MKQTRKIIIQDRVLSLEDLQRVAQVFEQQHERAKTSDHDADTEYEIQFSDNMSIKGDSAQILDDELLKRPGRPVQVRFDFRNLTLNQHMSLSLSHGESSYGNYASVSANDPSWVKENFLSLKDAIETARPQSFWFRKHKGILLVLVAFGVGLSLRVFSFTVAYMILGFLDISDVLRPLANDSGWGAVLSRLLPVIFIFEFAFYLLLGSVFAYPIRSWFLEMWPNIELDIGSEHLKVVSRFSRPATAGLDCCFRPGSPR